MTAPMIAPNPQASRFFPAEVPVCPCCSHPLRRATGGSGSFYLTCDNRVAGKKCGQTAHLLAAEGVVAVTAISKEQYERFRRTYARASTVYGEVGVIPTRPPAGADGIPEHPCVSCSTLTKLFDLYAGECRECRDKRSAASE